MPRKKKPEPKYQIGETVVGLQWSLRWAKRGVIIDVDSPYWKELRGDPTRQFNFTDGFLYLMEWPDRTRAWMHEQLLAPLSDEADVIADYQAIMKKCDEALAPLLVHEA